MCLEATNSAARHGVVTARLFVLSLVALLGTVSTGLAQTADQAQKIQQLQDDWNKCIDAAYGTAKDNSGGLNAAVEQAFQTCAAQEMALTSFAAGAGAPLGAMDFLKSQMRQVLLIFGHVST